MIYAAIAVWLLGLAVPVTASYIIAAVMVAPALTKVGVAPVAAHMFIFYYAVLSEVSPPTALSPFAAAALTGGNPFRTMMLTWKYTLPAFLVPFVFTLSSDGLGVLLQASAPVVAVTSLTAAIGVVALALAAGGWITGRANAGERASAALAGLLLLYPGRPHRSARHRRAGGHRRRSPLAGIQKGAPPRDRLRIATVDVILLTDPGTRIIGPESQAPISCLRTERPGLQPDSRLGPSRTLKLLATCLSEDPARGTSRPRAVGSPRYLQALKVPLALVFIAATAMMTYYWVYVQRAGGLLHQSQFPQARDDVPSAGRGVQERHRCPSLAAAPRGPADPRRLGNAPRTLKDDLDLARRSTPILSLVTDLPTLYGNAMLVPALRDSTGVQWVWTSPPPGENDYRVEIPLDGAFERLLAPYARKDLFDSVLLVAASGRVLLQSGDRTLQLTSLANLLQSSDSSPARHRRRVSRPKRWRAPPTPSTSSSPTRPTRSSSCPAVLRSASDKSEQGWLVAGLVSKSSLRTASLSVSFSVMALLTGLLLLAVFSWPFVKLTLIGRLQRVPFHDVVLIGFCIIFGGALVTIAALDFYGYGKLKATLDGQLEAYAESIADNVETELKAVTAQLDLLDKAASEARARRRRDPEPGGSENTLTLTSHAIRCSRRSH